MLKKLRAFLIAVALSFAYVGAALAQGLGGSATITVTSATSANVQIPNSNRSQFGFVIIAPSWSTSNEVFYKMGTSNAVAATTSDYALPSGGICVPLGPNTFIAAVTATGGATVRVTQIATCTMFAGGSGAGGGGGGGGGNVNITGINGDAPSLTTPLWVAPSTGSAWTVTNAGTFAVQAAQSGTWNVGITGTPTISGTVTANLGTLNGAATAANQTTINTAIGSTSDAACGTATGTCSLIALQKFNNSATSGPLATQSATISVGGVGLVAGGAVGTFSSAYPANGVAVGFSSAGTMTAASVNTGSVDGGTQRVVLASDQPTVPAAPTAGTTGGATPSFVVAANSNNSTNLKASAGTVYGIQTSNISASTAYFIKLYDKATAPTCGTDTPVAAYVIPPSNGGNNVVLTVGKKFTLGIGFCIVAGIADNDNTSVPAATILANIDWN